MFNVKWGIISGGAAFVLAFLTSMLMGHTGLFIALLRATGFGALFFALGVGVWALITAFIPELLQPGGLEDPVGNIFSGSDAPPPRVNITVEDRSNAALPDTANGYSGDDDLGNIADLISGKIKPAASAAAVTKAGAIGDIGDIDQNMASGYNGEVGEDFLRTDSSPAENGFGGLSVDIGNFAHGGAEETDSGGGGSFEASFSLAPAGREEILPPERKVSGNRSKEFRGDFNPKEIAVGIRTVLEKDK